MLTSDYINLDKLIALPKNPKLHALQEMGESFSRWGFVKRIIVNKQTGHIVGGNGRCDELKKLKLGGDSPPENIKVKDDVWLVPVDYVDIPVLEELPLAIALNNLEELGGWDIDLLDTIVKSIDITGTGFTAQNIGDFSPEVRNATNNSKTTTKTPPPEYEEYDEFDTSEVEDVVTGENLNLSYIIYVSFSDEDLFKRAVETLSLGNRTANMERQRYVSLDGDEFLEAWEKKLL